MRFFPWKRKPVALTHKEKCIESARWSYGKLKRALEAPVNSSAADRRAGECFWFLVMCHFDEVDGVYGGYTIDLTFPAVIERVTVDFKNRVIYPKMQAIALCGDPIVKATLVEELTWIMMAGVFDCSGGTIHSKILRDVLEAEHILEVRNRVKSTQDEWLPQLGFAPHCYQADGQKAVTWYWPAVVTQAA